MDTWDLLFSSSVLSLAFYFHLLSLSVQINHPPQIVKETVGLVVICFKCTFKKHILTVKEMSFYLFLSQDALFLYSVFLTTLSSLKVPLI